MFILYIENIIHDLKDKQRNLVQIINEIDERLPNYRKGSLFVKDNYCYIKYYDSGKTISHYVGSNLSEREKESILLELKNHKTLQMRKKEYQKELNEINKLIQKYESKRD